MNTTQLLNKLIDKKDLTAVETKTFLMEVMKGNVLASQIAAILTAFNMKGETVEEIFGLVEAMRQNMIQVNAKNAIDVCGTGGDGSNSFNISTAVTFVIAGTGIKVAKHGNRAASSKCGSADVMDALGVNINLSKEQVEKVFEKIGIVFLFAPNFHPAMKIVSAVRKELQIRTVFNFLGPFANPASVTRQLIGVSNIEIAKKLIEVGKKLNYKHLIIVSSNDGLDEISVFDKTKVFELKNNKIKKILIDPKKYGFKKYAKKEIAGGSAKQNSEFIKEILNGVKNGKRDIVILNSAVALLVSEKVKTIREGIKLAEESIDRGKAKQVLENLIKETQKYA